MDGKIVNFRYDSNPVNGRVKITMNFDGNLVMTNDGKTKVVGPNINVLGYAPNGLPIIAAKECLEEMLALINSAVATK